MKTSKNKHRDALLVIGTESLPARFVPPALEQLEKKASEALREARLPFGSLKAYGTPRRLALVVEALGEASEPLVKEAFGPSAKLLKDPEGRFTPQALGFAKAHGVSPEKLEVGLSPRGEVLVVRKTIPGEPAAKILARVWPQVIGALQFPKTMEWEPSRFRFARPIRSIVALFGGQIVPFSIAGVKSGRKTPGLMATGSKPLSIAEPSNYLKTLRNACVLADHSERREALVKALEQAVKKTGHVLENEPDLLEETTFLTECPAPVVGSFPPEFLRLPSELVVTVLKKQLKFFALRDKAGGLVNQFIGVRDGISEGQKEVQLGYERVVIARLDDAVFYVDKDMTRTLRDMREKLKGIQFHPKLGSLHDKSRRVAALADGLCEALRQDNPVDEAAVKEIAELGYADLASEVIREFPELQGRIGGEYARRTGLSERSALGLSEFYFPLSARSALPATLEGCVAALAAKLDTLAGDFAVGLIPSGSEDPHGLRRQALGAVRILVERQLDIDLAAALEKALSLQPGEEAEKRSAFKLLVDFLDQRLRSVLEEAGYGFDEIRAVLENASGFDRVVPRVVRRVAALHAVRPTPEFGSLAAAFKRAANILKGAPPNGGDGASVDPSLFAEPAEHELFNGLRRVQDQIQLRLDDGEFEECLRAMVQLKPAVDLFFEKVMVMADDPGVRGNRLALLRSLVALVRRVADLSQLQ